LIFQRSWPKQIQREIASEKIPQRHRFVTVHLPFGPQGSTVSDGSLAFEVLEKARPERLTAHQCEHVDRGYRDLPGTLAALGADVTRVTA